MIAVFTLQKITGIKSSVRFGDTSVYPNQDAFRRDKSKWREWVSENSCNLKMPQAESILQSVKASHPYLVDTDSPPAQRPASRSDRYGH